MRIEIKKVSAWQCCRCKTLHTTEKEAQDCCACDKCGGRFNRSNSYGRTCDGCQWGERVREARRSIRRHQASTADYQRSLADLLARKPKKALAGTDEAEGT